jgi:hypothetical protein
MRGRAPRLVDYGPFDLSGRLEVSGLVLEPVVSVPEVVPVAELELPKESGVREVWLGSVLPGV